MAVKPALRPLLVAALIGGFMYTAEKRGHPTLTQESSSSKLPAPSLEARASQAVHMPDNELGLLRL